MSQATNDPTAAGTHAGGLQTYTTFRLREGLFGIAANVVKEVTALPPLTRIPHAPAAVRGYVNLRGHVVLVVDLNCLLLRETATLHPESRLIVFKSELGDTFGVLVERIGEIVELSAKQIETHCAGTETSGSDLSEWQKKELLCGDGKLDGELLSIIEARRLLPCLERAVGRRSAAADGRRFASLKEISL